MQTIRPKIYSDNARTGVFIGGVAGVGEGIFMDAFTLMLNAFAIDYFQAAMLGGFLLAVLGTAVGAVVGGANKRAALP